MIVETDVARNERRAEFARRIRQAVDGGDEFTQVFGIGRIAEIEAIGHAHRTRADGCDVSGRFAHGKFRRTHRVDRTVTRIAIDRQRDGKRCAGNRHDDTGIRLARGNRGRAAHDGIEALVDRRARTHVAMRENLLDRRPVEPVEPLRARARIEIGERFAIG